MRYLTRGAPDTFEFGAALGAGLAPGDCVLLSGELGAGKSVLARGIAAACGIAGPMPSPTFTIMIPYGGEKKLYHFDLYRLSDPDEFYAAGLEEFLGGDGIAVIEWPEMADLEPAGAVRVRIARGEAEDERIIETAPRHGLERWEAHA
jgi:tRNA threonylcarbamoyladenosine biosynthesis protein TsaE